MRAGAQHDRIGASAKHILRIHLGSQLDLNRGLFKLALIPNEKLADFAAFRLTCSKPELPAELGAALDDRHPVAALGGNARGFKASRAAADDQNVARRLGRGQSVAVPLELAPDRWIGQAGDPVIAHPAPDAKLIAVDAGADVIGAALARLVGKVGVGDLAAHDAHQICHTAGNHCLRVGRCLDPCLRRHHRMADRLFELLGIGRAQHHVVLKRGDDLGVLIEVAPRADREVVDETARIQIRRDLLLVRNGEPAGIGLGARYGHADDEILAGHLADAAAQLDGEARAVFQAAAPAIVAPVGERRPELVDQAIIAGKKIDAVEARIAVAPGGLDEALDQFLDLGLDHGVTAPRVVHRGHTRRRPIGLPRIVLIAMTADMIDLVDHHRAVAVAFVGNAAEVRDNGVVFMAEVAACQHSGAVRWRRLDDDHRRAAAGALTVIGEVALGGQAVLAHVGGVCAEHDAVLERLVAQLEGCEQVRKLLRHGDVTSCHGADVKSQGGTFGDRLCHAGAVLRYTEHRVHKPHPRFTTRR